MRSCTICVFNKLSVANQNTETRPKKGDCGVQVHTIKSEMKKKKNPCLVQNIYPQGPHAVFIDYFIKMYLNKENICRYLFTIVKWFIKSIIEKMPSRVWFLLSSLVLLSLLHSVKRRTEKTLQSKAKARTLINKMETGKSAFCLLSFGKNVSRIETADWGQKWSPL